MTIDSIIEEFAVSSKALRDYVELIRPFLEEHITNLRRTQMSQMGPLIIAVLKSNESLLDKVLSKEEDSEKLKSFIEQYPAEIIKDDAGDATFKFTGKDIDARKIFSGLKTFEHSIYQEELLYRSSLLNLISSLEWFLSQLLHVYFEKFPDAVGTRDNVFSLDDLKAFETIHDARVHLIDSKVEDILRGKFEDWIKYLKERVNLSMSYIEPYMAQMIEVYQRRNIIVHNGGRINSIYLSNVAPELTKGLKPNDRVQITPEYFNETINTFELCFLLIAAELWKKVAPDDELRSRVLLDLGFHHILEERWKIGEGLSQFLIRDKLMSESRRLRGQINYWQSLKWQGRFEEVRSEVEKADFSAKEPVFKLALFALLDNEGEFFRLLPITLKNGDLNYQDLDTWPVFRGIRQGETYAQFRESNIEKFSFEANNKEISVKQSSKRISAKSKAGKTKASSIKKHVTMKSPGKRVAKNKLKR